MAACTKCGAPIVAREVACAACGTTLPQQHTTLGAIFTHFPHPHILHRRRHAPKPIEPGAQGPISRFNSYVGVRITNVVGTMWCAYLFAALALVSLPSAVAGGTAMLVAWTAQTFIQLVLLSIIMVGQKIAGEATDKRAIDTYNDAEAVLHESMQIQQHLAAQDAVLQQLIIALGGQPVKMTAPSRPATADDPPMAPAS